MTATIGRDAVPVSVRELAADLLPECPRLGAEMADHLLATIPELADRDDVALADETRASCEANIAQILRLLRLGARPEALVVPIEAAEWVRGLVRRGITLASLLRGYRVGHAWLWDRWSLALHERLSESHGLVAAQECSTAFMFAYVDRISDVLVSDYGTERERVVRSAEQVRAETVRSILAGDAIDEEAAGRRLGYALGRRHVALRLSSCGSELRGLERAVGEAAAALCAAEPLVVRSGVATIDVWCGGYGTPDIDAVEVYAPPEGIRVAVGTAGDGLAAFRRSHAEALEAARVAALARDAATQVTSYRRVELVSLLAHDLPRARAFVTARLGPLASAAEPTARLRETVLAFIVAAGSSTRVAKQLYVHQNTVAYRIKRAEELLGRRVTDDPIELVCALRLADVIGPAVLTET